MGNPRLQLRLLGDFQLLIDHEPILSVNTARLQSLLAYLALHRSAQLSRRHLAFTFWPDKTESQASNNLRQLLHQLRQALPDSDRYIYSNASSLVWKTDSNFSLDVNDFEVALAAARTAEQTGDLLAFESNLEKSLSLYRGELLPSCYDDWIVPEREDLNNKYIEGLEKVVHLLESQHNYPGAIPYARQLLQMNPLSERNYQILMRLYALNGDRANALHVYHQCADTLQKEFGEEPGLITQEVYHGLLRNQRLADSPLSTSGITVSPPLIGRESEWNELISAWQRATSSGAYFALLVGEAGIGKSRLAEELAGWVARQGFNTAQTRSYAVEGRLAYGPIADWLRSKAIRPYLNNLRNVWKSEIVRLLPELLIAWPDLPQPEPFKENWQRQGFYHAIMQAILSAPQPLLLFMDDLQWCDPESLEFLHYVMRSGADARFLLVCTVRSEDLLTHQALQDLLVSLRNAGRMIEIDLNPIDAAETARLASQVAGKELETSMALRLFEESEGNPFFILEMVRSGYLQKIFDISQPSIPLQESHTEFAEDVHLPPRVKEVLLSRLNSLAPPVRQLTSLAATIGRAFSFDVLAQASEASEEDLLLWLDELWQRGIVRVLNEGTYDFSHDKLREVAYQQISLPHRRVLHRRVALALETLNPSNLNSISGQLAVHFDKAGLSEQAIHYYYRGALSEQEINANHQAIKLLKRALTLLSILPEGDSRDENELKLLTALGVSTVDTLGHGSEEGVSIYDRILALYQKMGEHPAPPILRAKAIDYIARAEFKQALVYSEQLIQLAVHLDDRPLMVEANYALGVTKFWLGDFQPALEYLQEAVKLYDPRDSGIHISLYSQDPRVICQSRLAFTLWCLGYPNQAAEASRLALDYASEIAHPWSLAYASFWNLFLQVNNGAFDLAKQGLLDLTRLCDDFQIRLFLTQCTMLNGWLDAEQGDIEAGIEQIRDGMENFHAGGAQFQRPYFLSLLAELMGRQGNAEQGLTLIKEALELVEKSGERWCEAEILRRQGELLGRQGDLLGMEETLQKSMRVARNQEAKILELRAGVALGKVWMKQGKVRKLKELIFPLYCWFSEDEQAPEVREARHLLDEIGINLEN
jgi:DNA-binding SARP family transcriptional activator/predicted ATPase